jgi:amino acid transporter
MRGIMRPSVAVKSARADVGINAPHHMLVTHTERPRELKWYHAGPMLYGDWGTSRFYVLGLALYYSRYASFWYVAGVCALVAAVGWAYTIICRCYPDGGGVYSAARQTSKTLAVIGALLLFADYIVTAALSALDGMHYLGIKEVVMAMGITRDADVAEMYVRGAAILGIILVGAINFIGPKKAGTFALIVACGTLLLTIMLVIAVFVPHETVSAMAKGWESIHRPEGTAGHIWHNLVNVVLALSGVEAIANMTGIMVPPVGRTSKKAIWPVLIEVVVLNLVLAVAMNGLPAKYTTAVSSVTGQQITLSEKEDELRSWERANPTWKNDKALSEIHDKMELTPDQRDALNRVLWVMAKEYAAPWFANICGFVFGLLLLSAVNTAVADMVSIQYVMARDRELPQGLMKLNTFGVPWRTLVAAVALPALILLVTGDLDLLAGLYAIGVVGAIGINLGSCCLNRKMPLKIYERAGMGVLALIMAAIETTLAIGKPHALLFAGGVLGAGLFARVMTKSILPRTIAKRKAQIAKEIAQEEQGLATTGTPAEELDMSRPKILVASRGGKRLLEFAARYARQMNGIMFVLFVRQVKIVMGPNVEAMSLEEDDEARHAFMLAAAECRKEGVQMVPIYVTSPDVPYAILDFAATYNASAVLMGVSRQGALLRALKGDVLSEVADNLPEDIPLLIHA